jgi:predicted nucleic acid-binding protein
MRVFLDSTCWVAASASELGGSALILELARGGALAILTSDIVLAEASKNIREKRPADAALRHMRRLADMHVENVGSLTADEEAAWAHLTADKDCHILAAAVKGKADVLVTLDRKHLLTDLVRSNFPITVQDTREFLMSLDEAECQAARERTRTEEDAQAPS